MKFSAQFEASQFPEWKKKYLRYVSIKQHIHQLFDHKLTAQEKQQIQQQQRLQQQSQKENDNVHVPADENSSSSSLLSIQDRSDQIMTKLLTELHKMDNFYKVVEGELESGFKSLKAQINIIVIERTQEENHSHHPHTHTYTYTHAQQTRGSLHRLRESAGEPGTTGAQMKPSTSNTELNQLLTHEINSQHVTESTPLLPPSSLQHSYSTGSVPVHHISIEGSPIANGSTSTTVTTPSPTPSSSGSSQSSGTSGSASMQSLVHAGVTQGIDIHPASQQPKVHTKQADHPVSSSSSSSYSLPVSISSSSSVSSSVASALTHTLLHSHLFHPLHPQHSHHTSETDLTSALLPLKSIFIHLLRRMTMLIHYVDINIYAYHRLLSCFEQRSGLLDIEEKFSRLLSTRYICTSKKLEDELIPATYQLFADYYEGGDVDRAKVFLLSRLAEAEYDRSDTFLLGLKIGIILMLMIWNLMILVKPTENVNSIESLSDLAPVYRCTGLLIVFLWLWGACVMIWDAYRISFVFVFQLNPRNRLSHFVLFNESANMTIVYLVNVLLLISHYETALDKHISGKIYPLSLLCYVALKLFFPGEMLSYWNSRKTLLSSLGNVLISPFGVVKFRDSYVGDVLTSMVKIFVDVEYGIVLLLSVLLPSHASSMTTVAGWLVPLIICLPLWFRFMQCLRRYYDTGDRWPHLVNACKYAVAHSVVIVSAFHPSFTSHHANKWEVFRYAWLGSTIISSLYTFIWDVTQDWGLMSAVTEGKGLLRDQLLYHSPAFYYWAIVSNFFLRFGWVLTLVPFSLFESPNDLTNHTGHDSSSNTSSNISNSSSPQQQFTYFSYLFQSQSLLLSLLTLLELLRRFQWSLLRVEWEQISNGSGFRLSYYVPMFFQQQIGGGQGQPAATTETSAGVVVEVVIMVVIVVVIAVLGAIL